MTVSNFLKASIIVGGVVLILFFLMSIEENNNEKNEFEKFITTYNKSYVNETEWNVRFKRFQVRITLSILYTYTHTYYITL